jgi:hypothetical protein
MLTLVAQFIAALLILNLSGPSSFITLANILNRPLPTAFLTQNTQSTSSTCSSVLRLLENKIPNLHAHLTNPQLQLDPVEYLAPIFTSLFCSHRFDMDIASRIWDVYVFEGDEVLIHAACATLAKLEGKLYGSREEVLNALCSSKVYDLGKDDEFVMLVQQMGSKKEDKRPNSW